MNNNTGKIKKPLLVLLIMIIILLLHHCMLWATTSADYETRDIADYGIYIGNSEEYMHEYVERFFPAEISDYFQDVTYVFRSRAVDEYGFEVYLEFSIEDKKYFDEYVLSVTEGLLSRPFHFDNSFQEYVVFDTDNGFVYDHIQLGREYYDEGNTKPYYQIHYADIAKVLVDYEAHSIIFVALAVHDGGGSDTAFFCEFFDRFGIEPREYATYTGEISNHQTSNQKE